MMGLDMHCHACGWVARSGAPGPTPWRKLIEHRKMCNPDDYVNGLPFWMLEERLTDKEYAILWTTASKAAKKDLGKSNSWCWE